LVPTISWPVVNLDEPEALGRLCSARVARLATASSGGRPHIVPVTFAVRERIIVTAIDHKPKTTSNLKRLRNIEENNRVSLLVDEYDDQDWARLWWVRADGMARLIEDARECELSVSWLRDKYEQYRSNLPEGPVIRIDIDALRGWSYAD